MTTATMQGFPRIYDYFVEHPSLRFLKMQAPDIALKRRKIPGARVGTPLFYVMVTTLNSDHPLGRIDGGGLWKERFDARAQAASSVLAVVEVDVQKAMIDEGQASHHCCYCGLPLTDPESQDWGYGPVCARKYGLPHSNRHGF